MDLKQKIAWLTESKDIVTRIDHQPKYSPAPKDFNKDQQTYVHNKDWSKSGNVRTSKSDFNEKPGYSKGLFGGSEKATAPYVAPRDVPWISYTHPKTNEQHVVFNKSDKDKIKNARPILSKWSKGSQSKFSNLPNKEEFSESPGKPTSRQIISNPIKHMEKHGYKVRFVEDLKKHRKRLQNKGIEPDTVEGLD
jgi:hypothetical protein